MIEIRNTGPDDKAWQGQLARAKADLIDTIRSNHRADENTIAQVALMIETAMRFLEPL